MIFLPERKPNEPQYELTIRWARHPCWLDRRRRNLAMAAVLLVYGEDMVIEDVNGQELGPRRTERR